MVRKLYNLIYDCTSEEEEVALIKNFLEQENISTEKLLKIAIEDQERAVYAFKTGLMTSAEFYKVTTGRWTIEDYVSEYGDQPTTLEGYIRRAINDVEDDGSMYNIGFGDGLREAIDIIDKYCRELNNLS